MAKLTKYVSTLDREPIIRATKGWRSLRGERVRFGAMAPDGGAPPEHTGHDGKPKGVTTNDVLAFIEYGTQGRAERPVIRYVQYAHANVMRVGAAAVVKAIAQHRAHRPLLEEMARKLADLTRDRILAVGAVDTGQTLESIHGVVERPR